MEDPLKMQQSVKLSEKYNKLIDDIFSKHTIPKVNKEDMKEVLERHDKLFIDAVFIDNDSGSIMTHHLLLQGLIVRSRSLMEATLRDIQESNAHATVTALRAQCETLASACYIQAFPDKLEEVLYGSRAEDAKIASVNIITQLEHTNKKYYGVLQDYEGLSEIAHPNFYSHISSFKVLDDKARKVQFSSSGHFKEEDLVTCVH